MEGKKGYIDGMVGSFKSCVQNLHNFLLGEKKEIESVGAKIRNPVEERAYLLQKREGLFRAMDNSFAEMWDDLQGMEKDTYKEHQRYMQKMLLPLLQEDLEINTQIFTKPLGYSGDFKVMNYIYDYSGTERFLGKTLYEKLMNNYTCNIPIAQANVERKEFLKSKLQMAMMSSAGPLKVLSVGGGSLRELIELIKEKETERVIEYSSIDFEPKAVEYVRGELKRIPEENREKVQIDFVVKDIKRVIRDKEFDLDKQDLIYSAGITDYFGDRVCRSFIERFYGLLREGGELIVCNISQADNDHRAYYETLGGWKMKHRDGADLASWVEGLECGDSRVEPLGTVGGYLKLHVRKKQ